MHNQDHTYQNLPDMHKLWQTCQEYLLGQAGHGYCSVRSLHSYSFVVGCSRRKSYPEPPHVPNITGVFAYMLVPSRACLHFFTRQGLYTSLMMQTKTPQLYPCPYSTEVSSRHSSDVLSTLKIDISPGGYNFLQQMWPRVPGQGVPTAEDLLRDPWINCTGNSCRTAGAHPNTLSPTV